MKAKLAQAFQALLGLESPDDVDINICVVANPPRAIARGTVAYSDGRPIGTFRVFQGPEGLHATALYRAWGMVCPAYINLETVA